jgi:hypothetical protein
VVWTSRLRYGRKLDDPDDTDSCGGESGGYDAAEPESQRRGVLLPRDHRPRRGDGQRLARDKSANHNEGAYSASASAAAASPVYRFWKPSDNTHFFTMSESEKDKLVNEYFDVFTFEKAAWYAYAV